MRTTTLASAAAALAACGSTGAFRQAALFRECHAGEQSCKSLAPGAPLAVGARLRPDVDIEIAGSATPDVRVMSGRPDVVGDDGGILRGISPGVAPILISADDGTVIDFVHVWVATPTRLTAMASLARTDAPEELTAPLQLVSGESRWITPAIFGGAQRLAGAGDISWTVECDAGAACPQIALLTDGAPDRRRLVARTPGKARVVLEGLGLHANVDVEVVP
ncbi:MAG TPA: hypothetical protein VL463_27910 [Kofleriaceae bacterium]|nr:hypothetical protein [Kofleriaceae bacterium]